MPSSNMIVRVLAVALAAGCFQTVRGAESAGLTPDAALNRLLDGNARFVSGAPVHPGADAESRRKLVAGQHPFAVVLGCSDSRVAPEVLFDQGLGDLFTVRVAGNVAETVEQGSIEYAVEHLGAPLIMVLGHTGCGAVKACADGGKHEGNVGSILRKIEPSVRLARSRFKDDPGHMLAAAVEENVRANARLLLYKNPLVKRLVAEGRLKVVAGIYDLAAGEVRMLDMEKELREERQARRDSLRKLGAKWQAGQLSDPERDVLMKSLLESVQESL